MKAMTVGFCVVFLCGLAFPGDLESTLAVIDDVHETKDYDKTMELLVKADKEYPNQPAIYWRIAQGYFDFADQNPDDEEWQKKNIYPGFEYAKKALAMDPNSADVHKWYAILIGRVGEIEGTKQKILNSYDVRDHTLRAIELDPSDDGNYHVMGRWHYTLADLSWVERQIASIIYATPPEASFEEAIRYFKKAAKLADDDFRHKLWLAKSYIEVDEENKARGELQYLLKMTPVTDADRAMQQEARELLEDL